MRKPRRAGQSALAFYASESVLPASRPRKNGRPEAACLVEVLKTLRGHPLVAWVERQNSGAFRDGKRFVRFGWTGCSDVLGQLRDGRFLAVEVKVPGGKASDAQRLFLDRVRAAGGAAFIATSAADVFRNLPSEIPQ